MTLDDFVSLCRGYANLGDAVTDQINDVLAGQMADCNANALRLIRDWLRKLERVAWDDDELGGEVTETLRLVEEAIEEARR